MLKWILSICSSFSESQTVVKQYVGGILLMNYEAKKKKQVLTSITKFCFSHYQKTHCNHRKLSVSVKIKCDP